MIASQIITEPNSIAFELCSLSAASRVALDLFSLGNQCVQWITESLGLPYP